MTVQAIVAELAEDPETRITRNAVYMWLAGHVPDHQRARALVQFSEGALSYEDIYSHQEELTQVRAAV